MRHNLHPAEQRSLDAAVSNFAEETGFDLAFGGFEERGCATVTSLFGTQTLSLNGLEVATGKGLSGRAMSENRPRLTADYARSSHITHDYDTQVLSEGIKMLFAVPVLVDGSVRAVLYGGSRSSSAPGNTLINAASSVVRAFARDIRIQDEVNLRIAAMHVPAPSPQALPTSALEVLRESYAELRGLASEVADPTLRAKLVAIESRLAHLGGVQDQRPLTPLIADAHVTLSPRELDVLSQVALGGTNAEIGHALGLTESTVKSYLKTAMTKLESSTRHAAVATARRAGLLP